MHLGMKTELERQVIDAMYLAQSGGRSLLRFNHIASLSGVKKPTLQRILLRLVKRGWIRKREEWIWRDGTRAGGVFHLIDLKHPISGKETLFPKEIVDDYERRMKDLEAERNNTGRAFDAKFHRNGEWNRKLGYYTPKCITGYSLVTYPFLSTVGLINKPLNFDKQWGTPVGTRRYWKRAAREMIKVVKIKGS